MKPILAIVGSAIGLTALGWGLTYHDLIFTSFFAPKYENVRRNTFEQSKSFRTGAVLPSKQSCLNAGGKWSEGIQYGKLTQFCTYN